MDSIYKSKVDKILTIITIIVIGYFSVPKLLALKPSVDGFNQFAHIIPIKIRTFMYLTGAVELITALILISSFFIYKYGLQLKLLGYFMVFSTMIGALFVEFFGRPKPDKPLVIIAVLLLIISAYQFYKMKDKIKILYK